MDKEEYDEWLFIATALGICFYLFMVYAKALSLGCHDIISCSWR